MDARAILRAARGQHEHRLCDRDVGPDILCDARCGKARPSEAFRQAHIKRTVAPLDDAMGAGRAGLFALRQGLEDPFRPEAGLSESLAFKVHACAPIVS